MRALWFSTATALLLLGWGTPAAETNEQPGILFLQLKLKNKSISLVKTTTAPGVVKPPRVAETGIQYELLSATGELLWKGTIEDPAVRHVEYEDPPGSGKMKRKTIRLEETEFTLRVPLIAAAQRVEFYLLEPSAVDAKPGRNSTRKLLGASCCLPNQIPPHETLSFRVDFFGIASTGRVFTKDTRPRHALNHSHKRPDVEPHQHRRDFGGIYDK